MQAGDELIYPEDGSRPTSFRRKVVKMREVIETKEVKVPVMQKKLVPCTVERQIKQTKFVEEPSFEEVEETYIDYEEEVAQREREIWVKEVEEEEYIEKVPVQKTRTVKQPITNIVEEDATVDVEVDEYLAEDIEGWRIDEVEDRKIVEVEEWEIFELMTTPTGEVTTGEVKELGMLNATSKRYMGTRVYKLNELDQAKDDGHDLDSIPVDSEVDVVAQGLFHGSRAVSSMYKNNNPEDGAYDAVEWSAESEQQSRQRVVAAPAQEGAGQSSGAPMDDDEDADREPFNLEKCLEYTRKSLSSKNVDGLDVEEFVEQLRSRWVFVDNDQGGLVELDELRQAVWTTEEDNVGVPMPKGKFRKELQDIVDEIWKGCGSKPAFTVWDFIRFMLDEQLLDNVSIRTPPASAGWAHAVPTDEY